MEKYLLGFGSVYSLGASLVPNATKELDSFLSVLTNEYEAAWIDRLDYTSS